MTLMAALPALGALSPATASAAAGWNPGSVISVGGGEVETPDVAISTGGAATAVWQLDQGGSATIQAASRDAGESWGEPVDLSPPGRRAEEPHVALDDSGDAVAVWALAGGVIQAVEREAGGSWSEPVDLSAPGIEALEPELAMNGTGEAVAIWVVRAGSGYRVKSATMLPSDEWHGVGDLSNAHSRVLAPRVAINAAGDVTAAWERSEGEAGRIEATRRFVKSAWREPEEVSKAGEDCMGPAVAAGAERKAVLGFRCARAGGSVAEATLWNGLARTWHPPVTISKEAEGSISAFEVAMSPRGQALAIWTGGDHLAWSTKAPKEVHIRPKPWQAPHAIEAGFEPRKPKLSTDVAGDLVAVWNGGAAPSVQAASHLNWEGPLPSQVADLAGDGPADGAEVAANSHGDAVAVWRRAASGEASSAIEVAEYVKAPSPEESLPGLELLDPLNRSEDPLSLGGSWAQAAWTFSPGRVAAGWTRSNTVDRVNGAYWVPAEFADSGLGDAVSAQVAGEAQREPRSLSLWLNAPRPDLRERGYQLRLSRRILNHYRVEIDDWDTETSHTVVASGADVKLLPGSRFALVAKGNLLSAWTDTGSGFKEILTGTLGAAPRHDAGHVALSGTDPSVRLTNFSAGAFPAPE